MDRPTRKDIESYSKNDLVEFTDQLLDEIDYSIFIIRNLEKKLELALNELGAGNQKVLDLIEQIEQLKHATYGRSSEKTPKGDIFSQDQSHSPKSKSNSAKASSKPKRKKVEDKVSPDTPIHEVFHYASDEEKEELGLKEWEGHFETSDLISIIPTSIQIDRHHRQKYIYSQDGQRKFFTAKGPTKLREGPQYSIEFVSNLIANKYCFHLPFDRQSKMLAEKGLQISTSSLQNQADYAAFTLKSKVFHGILDYLQKQAIVEADDTTWPNLEDLKTRSQNKYYLWGMKDSRAVGFNIFNARSQKAAKDFLGKQEGILLSDAHNSFESLVSDKLILASDWAHTRRYFKKAEKFFPDECQPFLSLVNQLFSIEKTLVDKPPDEILKERQTKSKAVLLELRNLLDNANYLKSSSLGKAIGYTNRLWERLIVFLDHPLLPLSTNGIERSMRTPALGRKNHQGSKNMETAKNAALWYTIVETCKLNDVSSEEYICYAIKTVLRKQKLLLPWEYSAK